MKVLECVSILTTTACQLKCKNCPARYWFDKNKGFYTTIEQIQNFIKCTKESGYFYERIIISGGEPFIWKHLKEALVLLNNADITSRICIYTNAMWFEENKIEAMREIASLVDSVIVSKYPINTQKCDLLVKAKIMGKDGTLEIIDRDYFTKQTLKPIKNVLPAQCVCHGFGLYGDNIDVCVGFRFLASMLNMDCGGFPQYTIKMQNGYADILYKTNIHASEFCKYCVSNVKVDKIVGKEPWTDERGKECVLE